MPAETDDAFALEFFDAPQPFLEAAEQHRYELDGLSRLFNVSYEQAAHRLATRADPRVRAGHAPLH